MDCVDCHNRPTHIYLSPNEAVDRSLASGRLDILLPFIKAKSVEVLAKAYDTNDEAVNAIASDIIFTIKRLTRTFPGQREIRSAAR
jgi:hypothetical protein